MAIGLDDLVSYVDRLLNVRAFDEGAPSNGLLVKAGSGPIARLGAAVNTSFEAIEAAHQAQVDLLLVHHPTWPYIDLDLKPAKEERLRLHGISLYGAHASLDCAPEIGTADALAELVGLRVLDRFAEYFGGRAGVYGAATGGLEEFAARTGSLIGVTVRAWRNTDAFERVGVVTGAGGLTKWVAEARQLGCDTYLTGEGSMYTELYAREVGINLVFGTHYATEAPGIKKLASALSSRFDVPWVFIEESNPSRAGLVVPSEPGRFLSSGVRSSKIQGSDLERGQDL